MKRIVESVQNTRGPAYTTALNSVAGVEAIAIARAIDRDGYGAMDRLSCDFDPNRMQFMLSRWEAIFGIVPSPTDTFGTRRIRIIARWAMIGQPNMLSAVKAALQVLLGSVFVNIATQTPSQALQWWPGNEGLGAITGLLGSIVTFTVATGPSPQTAWYGQTITIANASNAANNGAFTIVGATFSPPQAGWSNASAVSPDYGVGGNAGSPTISWSVSQPANVPWMSNVMHLDIQVTQPPTYTTSQFYSAIGLIFPFLDLFMPSYVTWDWWQASPQNPGNMGFYADEPNLDVEVLDV